MSMFAKLTNKILGKKSDKVDKPYSDIPIFENVDSIGLPGLHTVNLANEVSLQGEDEELDESFMMESKTPTKSGFPRSGVTTRSGQKRARDALLGDKENVPKLPGASNILDNQKDPHGKVEKKKHYYDQKHADSDSEEASVTVESVDEESDEEDDDADMDNGSPVKKSKLGDDRFHTARSVSTKGAVPQKKKVGFTVEEQPAASRDADDMDYEENYGDYDETEREQLFSKVRHGHQDWVKQYIIDKKSDLSKSPAWSVDEKGNTLVHVAVQNNHKRMTSMLIKLGCDVNKTNKKGMTCLDYAELYHFNKLGEFLMTMDALNSVR